MGLTLQKSTNNNLAAADKLWVTNNLAHTIIKQIDLQLNGTLISPQSDTYHYKAYIEDLLNFNQEDGKTVLAPQGWFNAVDFPPEWTATNTNTRANAGAGHNDCQCLSANHKAALAHSIAETAIMWMEPVTVWCSRVTLKCFTPAKYWYQAWKSR